MKNRRKAYNVTIRGALAISLFSCSLVNGLLTLPSFANSNDKNPCASNDEVKASQEVINKKVFQVDKVKIEAPQQCVWAILTNYADTPKVYSKVTTCKVVVDEGAKKVVAFRVKAFRDLVTLDYTLDISEHFPSSIEWSRHDGAFKSNEGYWHIDPSADGKSCNVTYAKFVDGGPIPQFFVTKELKADMPVILASVKTSAETFYQNTLHENVVRENAANRAQSVTAFNKKFLPEPKKFNETTNISLKDPAFRTGL